jgi:hydroxymethylpyrimidine/phosphomethylpyrimidine kinase
MLSRAETIDVIAIGLDRHGAKNVVLDPVMVAAAGDRLLKPDAVEMLKNKLLPRSLVVTPNLAEAAALLGASVAHDEIEMSKQGEAILAFGPQAVLVKGGHAEGTLSTDLLIDKAGIHRFTARRIDTKNTHGTGCTLSSAIAAGLAKDLSLVEAVAVAKNYVSEAIEAGKKLSVGKGRGPTHHFYSQWRKLDSKQ